ncbi:MAG: biotin/lipoyl-binding protein, partial [Verrucomicrobiota bacterium]
MHPKPSNLDALRIDRSPTPPAGGRGGRGWLLLVGVLGVAAGGWWMLRTREGAVKPPAVQAQGQLRQEQNAGYGARTLLNASGYVTTRLNATVSSKVTGKVVAVLVEEGMEVAKDQILATLDASNAEAGLRLAEAQLAAARLNLAETEPMAEFTAAELKRLTTLGSSRSVSL